MYQKTNGTWPFDYDLVRNVFCLAPTLRSEMDIGPSAARPEDELFFQQDYIIWNNYAKRKIERRKV